MVNKEGMLFYSLFDGKQPLLMWVFGLVNKIIADPLLAGRLVSLVFSALTITAIYKLAKKTFSFPFFYLAPIIYILIPIFTFFDRQALMESALTAVGVWSLYFLRDYLEKKTLKSVLLLGITLGIGLLIKSTAIIFLLLSLFVLFWKGITNQVKKPVFHPYLAVLAITGLVTLILFPLFIQPQFKVIFTRGDRYNLTLKEIFNFPLIFWWQNLIASLKISFWHLTPVIFIFGLAGLGLSFSKKHFLYLFWFFGGIAIAILTARGLSPRYLVCLLPLVTLFTASMFSSLLKKNRLLGFGFVSFLLAPLVFSYLLVFQPLNYFNLLDKLTGQYSQKTDYVTGDGSGYALDQVRNFLAEKAQSGPLIVGVRLDAGNPENAILAYYFGSNKINAIHFDKQLFPAGFDINSLKSPLPIYFVSRSQHQGGLEGFLQEEVRFYKPEGKSYFGVYRFSVKQ